MKMKKDLVEWKKVCNFAPVKRRSLKWLSAGADKSFLGMAGDRHIEKTLR